MSKHWASTRCSLSRTALMKIMTNSQVVAPSSISSQVVEINLYTLRLTIETTFKTRALSGLTKKSIWISHLWVARRKILHNCSNSQLSPSKTKAWMNSCWRKHPKEKNHLMLTRRVVARLRGKAKTNKCSPSRSWRSIWRTWIPILTLIVTISAPKCESLFCHNKS